MKDIRAELLAEYEAGTLVYFEPPNFTGYPLAVSRSMIDQAMAGWLKFTDDEREHVFENLMRAIERRRKRLMAKKLKQTEADELASDCAIWLAHEILYGDGEKHLIKPFGRDVFDNVSVRGEQ